MNRFMHDVHLDRNCATLSSKYILFTSMGFLYFLVGIDLVCFFFTFDSSIFVELGLHIFFVSCISYL